MAKVDQSFLQDYLAAFMAIKARLCLGVAHKNLAMDALSNEYDV